MVNRTSSDYEQESGVYVQQPIAILDSGVGGLTVAREVMRQLPREKIIYFGDTARAPYGPRPAEEVIQYTREIVDYLIQFQPKMIVIACNTATAFALEDIRSRVNVPVVGVIHPGARAAIKRTQSGYIGVIGTEGTIRSRAYEYALKQLSPHIEVVSLACPKLVPLVEQGNFRSEETRHTVDESLQPLFGTPIDTLILGCTHYPFLAETISESMGGQVTLISSAEETARDISTILQVKSRLALETIIPVHQFYCSGDPKLFKSIAERWLNEQIELTPIVWQVPHIG
jgi:glutamate racemase